MKTQITKSLLIFVLVALFSSLSAQQTVLIIQGNVSNLSSQPVAGKQVQLMVDSVMGPVLPVSYTSVVMTDVNGNFVDTFILPANTFAAMVLAVVYDCINVPQYNFQWFYPPQPLPSMNFTICDSTVTTNCSANFLAGTSPNSLTVNFTDLSVPAVGSNIASWYWSFGDSTFSVLQNPVHNYLQAGTYQVCLTIIDSQPCSATDCQIVVVPGSATGWCSAGFTPTPVGGTTAVTFNNTSQSIYGPALHNTDYLWDMGDGTTFTTTTLSPFTHAYPSTGIYQVCITMVVTEAMTNTVVCQDTWCGTVVAGGTAFPTGNLFGTLTSNSSAAGPSMVYLIVHDSLTGMLAAIDTTYSIDSAGVTAYYFPGVYPGSYLVKAAMLPANPNYAANIPTYHLSSIYWSQATTINVLPNAITQASIDFVQGINPGGPGFIGGLISQGANKAPGDPIEGAQIMLLDATNSDQPVAYAYSDAAGEFGFSNIPFGTYKIYAEVLDKATFPAVITIDSNNPAFNGVRLVVGSSVVTYVDENPGVADHGIGEIFPNPATEICYIPFNMPQGGTVVWQITGITGKSQGVKSEDIPAGSGLISIDVKDISPGLYFVNIVLQDGLKITRRLVVK